MAKNVITAGGGANDIGDSKISTSILWTNPDSTVAFNPQTISLDLSEYDLIAIQNKRTFEYDLENIQFFIIDNSITQILMNFAYNSSATMRPSRKVTVFPTGITFDNAYESSSTTVNNKGAIPLKIIGVKGIDMTLLWQNSDVTTAFTSTTNINIDLRDYNAIALLSWRTSGDPFYALTICLKGADKNTHNWNRTSTYNACTTRIWNITDTGLIQKASYCSTSDSSTYSDGNRPWKVWGLKL